MNHLEPRPRPRDSLADANPPDEGWHEKAPGPEHGRIVRRPRTGSNFAAFAKFVPCPTVGPLSVTLLEICDALDQAGCNGTVGCRPQRAHSPRTPFYASLRVADSPLGPIDSRFSERPQVSKPCTYPSDAKVHLLIRSRKASVSSVIRSQRARLLNTSAVRAGAREHYRTCGGRCGRNGRNRRSRPRVQPR